MSEENINISEKIKSPEPKISFNLYKIVGIIFVLLNVVFLIYYFRGNIVNLFNNSEQVQKEETVIDRGGEKQEKEEGKIDQGNKTGEKLVSLEVTKDLGEVKQLGEVPAGYGVHPGLPVYFTEDGEHYLFTKVEESKWYIYYDGNKILGPYKSPSLRGNPSGSFKYGQEVYGGLPEDMPAFMSVENSSLHYSFIVISELEDKNTIILDGEEVGAYDDVRKIIKYGENFIFIIKDGEQRYFLNKEDKIEIDSGTDLEVFEDYAASDDGENFAYLKKNNYKIDVILNGKVVGKSYDKVSKIFFSSKNDLFYIAKKNGKSYFVKNQEESESDYGEIMDSVVSLNGENYAYVGYDIATFSNPNPKNSAIIVNGKIVQELKNPKIVNGKYDENDSEYMLYNHEINVTNDGRVVYRVRTSRGVSLMVNNISIGSFDDMFNLRLSENSDYVIEVDKDDKRAILHNGKLGEWYEDVYFSGFNYYGEAAYIAEGLSGSYAISGDKIQDISHYKAKIINDTNSDNYALLYNLDKPKKGYFATINGKMSPLFDKIYDLTFSSDYGYAEYIAQIDGVISFYKENYNDWVEESIPEEVVSVEDMKNKISDKVKFQDERIGLLVRHHCNKRIEDGEKFAFQRCWIKDATAQEEQKQISCNNLLAYKNFFVEPFDEFAPAYIKDRFNVEFGQGALLTEVCDALELILEGDLDSDGLSDIDEEYYKTDKNNSDTDKDGYLDGAEVKNGFNPNGQGEL